MTFKPCKLRCNRFSSAESSSAKLSCSSQSILNVFRRLLVASRALRRSGACGYFSSQPRERRNLPIALWSATEGPKYLSLLSLQELFLLALQPTCASALRRGFGRLWPFSSHPSVQGFRTSSSHVAKFSNPLSINTLHLSITWPFVFADRQVHGAGFVFCQRLTSKYVYFVILFYDTVTSALLVLPVILELSQLLAISAAIQYIHMFR
ncbi:hypothetical protein C8J57DRAFT_1509159 [Mycena rebaudengoi]|nr:hypothetical protein C8J57DRAFT_1509159 [Mycena rebaudengoi]